MAAVDLRLRWELWRARQDAHRLHRANRILRRAPEWLIEYPSEVGLAIWGIGAGVPGTFGVHTSVGLGTLPWWAQHAWGAAMLLAGIILILGVRLRRPDLLARGLDLLATTCVGYAVAVFGYGGFFQSWPLVLLLFVLGVFIFWRARWIRAREYIHQEISRESSR